MVNASTGAVRGEARHVRRHGSFRLQSGQQRKSPASCRIQQFGDERDKLGFRQAVRNPSMAKGPGAGE